jgi:ABC-type multidrug transport system fused ATPase/permease subunit
VVAVGAATANYLQNFMFGLSGERLTARLRKMSFKAMLRQDIAWFDDEKHGTGALTAKLATEAQLVQGLVGQRIGIITQLLVTIVAGLVIGFVYSWKMCVFLFLCWFFFLWRSA